MKWVIVSDRSTDKTDTIVTSYAKRHPFIHLLRNESIGERNTAAKVRAIALGVGALGTTDFLYFGNLDADISFDNNYFETLLRHFESDERLGVIGGWIFQKDKQGRAIKTSANPESVAGAVQFFRKKCFDQIGGYRPIPGGMEDGLAEITARYYGWKTHSYVDLPVLHHRELGTVGRSVYRARFTGGFTEYIVGYSMLYSSIRALSRVYDKPYLIGSLLIISGHLYGVLSRPAKLVPDALVKFIRREQRTKLWLALQGKLLRRPSPA